MQAVQGALVRQVRRWRFQLERHVLRLWRRRAGGLFDELFYDVDAECDEWSAAGYDADAECDEWGAVGYDAGVECDERGAVGLRGGG